MNLESSHSKTRKREVDFPMLPSSKRVFKETLESVPNDLNDATHKALDDEVLTEVGGGNPSMAVLLVVIVAHSNQQLDQKYSAFEVVKNLIADNVQLKDMLADAWKSKSFKAIRNISM
jgi:hypothetical protein